MWPKTIGPLHPCRRWDHRPIPQSQPYRALSRPAPRGADWPPSKRARRSAAAATTATHLCSLWWVTAETMAGVLRWGRHMVMVLMEVILVPIWMTCRPLSMVSQPQDLQPTDLLQQPATPPLPTGLLQRLATLPHPTGLLQLLLQLLIPVQLGSQLLPILPRPISLPTIGHHRPTSPQQEPPSMELDRMRKMRRRTVATTTPSPTILYSMDHPLPLPGHWHLEVVSPPCSLAYQYPTQEKLDCLILSWSQPMDPLLPLPILLLQQLSALLMELLSAVPMEHHQ